MALKKSELYASLWSACDELRGGMDASEYKDYILVLLFIKYVSDKYAGQGSFADVEVPAGASFADLVALKGTDDIGDQINKKIVGPLATANALTKVPDFNDGGKLGTGKEMVQRLTSLIAVFEDPRLDFSKNRAGHDDILGDAYEYLMRHFATESGKSKGQFYTPSEVSRLLADVLGIADAKVTNQTTVYDPTCGSGSLLLKVGDAARAEVTLYGQEKDATTSGLARMNMILHQQPGATIAQGNTLADPKFFEVKGTPNAGQLKAFDYVVANPPFSDKRWTTGLTPDADPHDRFAGFGVPPAKQGDYAYLLHIVRSLKSTGVGACILPHGVLFRGNAEAVIRKNLVQRGLLQAVIGLPPNLFYGTGIPACILVIDKKHAVARRGVFMIDASAGFQKDGNKNRLRERDLHYINDIYQTNTVVPGFSTLASLDEIQNNDFNLNLPRYIPKASIEPTQDLAGHLQGGIPQADIDALDAYWQICPDLRAALFTPNRPGYADLAVEPSALQTTIRDHPQFAAFCTDMQHHGEAWQKKTATQLRKLAPGFTPSSLVSDLGESLLHHYRKQPLLNPYAVYQHLMTYWDNVMQDDAYALAADGWVAQPHRVLATITSGKKKGQTKDTGWACDLVPKALIVDRYFAADRDAIAQLQAQAEAAAAHCTELEEEHGGDEGAFAEFDKINKAAVKAGIKELKSDKTAADELAVLKDWLTHSDQESALKKKIKTAEAKLDADALAHYPTLTESHIKTLVIQDKWLATLDRRIHGEMDRISQTLVGQVRELGDRYGKPMSELTERVRTFEDKVRGHLEKMGAGT